MKILVDENMPYVEPLFGDLGDIIPVNGRTLTAEQVREADVLLVRSVTKVNAELLSGNNKLKFVGYILHQFCNLQRFLFKHLRVRFQFRQFKKIVYQFA